MVNRVLLRKLWRDLLGRKGALLAVLAIVAVGVGVFVAMAGVYRDLDDARAAYYRDYRLADFSVSMKRAPAWAIEHVAQMPNVRAVRGRVNLGVRVDLPHLDEPISGTAISMPEHPAPVLNDILLRQGTWFSGRDGREVILNDAFAHANGLAPGSRIRVVLLDQQHDLLVVGTAMSPEFVYLIAPGAGLAPDPARFGVLYMPERFLQESCDLDGAYNQLIGLAHDSSRTALDNTLRLIEERLDPYGVTDSTPVEEQPSVRFLADELRGIRVGATIMPALFLVVAALVLNVLMGRLVVQQRSVVGTLKALGYSSGAVLRHYLAFGLMVGLAGGLAGVVLGHVLQGGMVVMYREFFALPSIDAHLYPEVLLGGMAVSVGFALAGTLRGVRYAARLAPAQAMRPPPPERGGKVLPERIPALWRPLPFRWKMMLRAVFRNPFRSSVCVLASVIATALIVATVTTVDALDYLMEYEFEQVSHQDITVALRDARGIRAVPEVESLPAVTGAEAELSTVCDLTRGPYRKRVGVTGLVRGGRLHTPLDATGRPIVAPQEGLVLSRKLAAVLDVRPGDTVGLRPLIGERREVRAPVVATVDSFLGLSAYADATYLSRLLGESWVANVLLVSTEPGSEGQRRLYAALKERPSVIGVGERTRAITKLNETLNQTLWISLFFLVLFAGLIAFGSVLNAALVSLNERQREVGTLRVLGYTPRQIGRIFSGESWLLNGTGIGLGLVAGVGLTHLLSMAYDTELYRFPVVIYPSRLAISAALMCLFVGMAQLILFRLIRKLPWLDVLKVKE